MELPDDISGLDPDTYIRLSGVHADELPSDWHVNTIVGAYTTPNSDSFLHRFDDTVGERVGIVLQRADASLRWIILAVEPSSDGDEVVEAQFADEETVYYDGDMKDITDDIEFLDAAPEQYQLE